MISARSHRPVSHPPANFAVVYRVGRNHGWQSLRTLFGRSRHHLHRLLTGFLEAPKMSPGSCDSTAVVEES